LVSGWDYNLTVLSLDSKLKIFYRLIKATGRPQPVKTQPLPQSGSTRTYYRFWFENGDTLMGSYNPEIKENIAHYTFTKHFAGKNLPVPDILAKDETDSFFILEDAGEETLLDVLLNEGLTHKTESFYRQAVNDLLRFQTEGIKNLDLTVAFPAAEFNARSVMWDLNYFKYYFVKTNNIIFDENRLENDFVRLTEQLQKAGSSFFMYRDFQARNIMVKNSRLTYIDFQGGRKGPLQYDVISSLYQAKARLPQWFRDELLNLYLTGLEKLIPGQKEKFLQLYPGFIFFRLMQVLGAYGFRGLYQRKAHFLQSIPPAIENLKNTMNRFPVSELPELENVFQQIVSLKDYDYTPLVKEKLNITLSSFSYKKSGIPVDITENGGGFVFDCRALPNPGRIDELKASTGLQEPVINYLKQQKEMDDFLDHVFGIVDQSIDNYLERKFDHLMISFGCTGGKHRSVYSAEKLQAHLKQKYGHELSIRLTHHQLKNDNLLP